MNRFALKIFSLIAVITLVISTSTFAQYTPIKKKPTTTSKKNDRYFDETGDFVHHLQYGVHLNASILSFSSNNFGIGVSPSIGYKFNKTLMAGITTGINYNYQRVQDASGQFYSFSLFDYNYGVYGRIRIFSLPVYIYSDYKNATYQSAIDPQGNFFFNAVTNKIEPRSQTRPESNLGLSYRSGSGYGWGTEFVVTYNVLTKPDDYRPFPFDVKIGFTYNY